MTGGRRAAGCVTGRRVKLRTLHHDCSGQMTLEWVMVTVVVVLPVAALVPVFMRVLEHYFYRIAGVLCLPFP